jgi:hypothetical protein
LKRLDLDTIELDQAVAYEVFAKQLRAGFEARQLDVPEWLNDQLRGLNRTIESKVADRKALRIRELKTGLANLETPAEKRARLKTELDALEGAPVAVGQ